MNKLKEFLVIISPNSRKEYLILVFFLLLYYPLGIYLSLNTEVIDSFDMVDLYLSFDNGNNIYVGAFENITHPLLEYFYYPIKKFHDLITLLHINKKIFTLFVVFLCAFWVSYSNLLVFKYLKNIIGLRLKYCLIILLFYAFFSGNIILSFTADSFTFSLFLLTLNMYTASYYLAKQKEISVFYYIITGIFIGGQTITNIIKTAIPLLFERNFSIKNTLHILKKSIFIYPIVTLVLLLPFRLNIVHFIVLNIKRKTQFAVDEFSLFDSFTSYFFGGNILMSSFRIDNSPWEWITEKGIYLNIYNSWYQYLIISTISIILILAVFKNWNNKLVWVLVLSFGIDLFYLLILKVGLNESFIYGGHFIFIIPLVIGWLFKRLKSKNQVYLGYFILLLTFIILINNSCRIYQFVELAKKINS